MKEHVLLIYPHPDDEVFFCSGSVMQFVERNIPVTYVCLTLGEMGRGLGGANRHTLPQLRRKELEASCREMGIEDLRLWGYTDKTLEFEDPEPIIKRIQEIVDQLSPTLIMTFYPGHSRHPDHDATGTLVFEAIKRLPEQNRPRVYAAPVFKETIPGVGGPDVERDVTAYVDRKIACVKAYASQFGDHLQRIYDQEPWIMERLKMERFWIMK